MSKPVKHAVAVAIFRDGEILTIRRPDDDDELPGVWGLPAGTRRGVETPEDVIARIGREKLGASLTPVRVIASGAQERPQYVLNMELWEASMTGAPSYPKWKWAPPDILRAGAAAGSLCCELGVGLSDSI
jgi:ADP-ribose pyrophosphatase YjhB (NUDIX family)